MARSNHMDHAEWLAQTSVAFQGSAGNRVYAAGCFVAVTHITF
jgi:hypothetical protein